MTHPIDIKKHGAEGVVEISGELPSPNAVRSANESLTMDSPSPAARPGLLERLLKWQNGSVEAEEIAARILNLPLEFDGFRIAMVSDIHLKSQFLLADEVATHLSRAKPDLITILGDAIDGSTPSVDPLKEFIRFIASLAPCAAILGNNEYASAYLPNLRAAYRDAGIALLEDQSARITRGGAVMRLVGLQDPWAYVSHLNVSREPGMPNTEPIRPAAEPNRFDVLMIHRPHRASRYGRQGYALSLAGHAHGGQWRLPWGQGIFSPGQGLFPKLTSGLYSLGDGQLVVSRGLGNHEFPIRIHNRPHLPIVRLIRR
ncbi:MAG: metallophosphoesterase [Oscillospiraceae bacterium]|nr:metallophosphoesterase [Oscillospiraceae bacterium]